MMNGLEKSDSAIRAKKPANKAGKPAAEWVEQRAGTEGNTDQPRTRRTQSRGSVSPGLERVRDAARQRKKEKFTALLHHVTVDELREAYMALKRNAAPGVDAYRRPGAKSARSGSPLWKTRSSRGRQSRCSTRSTRKTSSDVRMDSDPGAVSTMRSMPYVSGSPPPQ